MPRAARARLARALLSRALLAGAISAAFLACLAAVSARDLWHKDALDYAQIAREITAGRGFSSRQAIYALHLRFLKDHGLLDQPWPNLHRFPLQSLAVAGLFALFGASTASALAAGILFAGLTAALLHAWAESTLGRWPAAAAVAILTLNGALFYETAAGIPELVTCFSFLLSAYLLWRGLARDGGASSFLGSGVALGLAVLARTNVLSALPGMLLVVLAGGPPAGGGKGGPGRRRGRRVASAVLLCLGLAAAVAPWAVRNLRVAGSPTFSLHSYFLVPSLSAPEESKKDYSRPWVRDFVSPFDYAARHPGLVWRKWKHNAGRLLRAYPWLAGTFLLPLLPWLALHRRLGGELQPIAVVVCSGFLLNMALCCLTDVDPERYYYFLLPPMTLLAVGVVWSTTRQVGRPGLRVAALVAAAALMARPTALAGAVELMRGKRDEALPPEQLAALRQLTGPDAIVFSDVSQMVTWYAGRRSVRNHFTVRDDGSRVLAVLQIDAELAPIDALYLTGRFLKRPGHRAQLEALASDPAFQRTFRCLPPFADGAWLCLRRSAAGSSRQAAARAAAMPSRPSSLLPLRSVRPATAWRAPSKGCGAPAPSLATTVPAPPVTSPAGVPRAS